MVVHPVDELQFKAEVFLNSNPWKRLRPQQQVWFVEFIATGNAQTATRCAYPAAKATSLVPMAYEIQRSPRIRAALEFWNKTANDIQMIRIVRAQLEAAKPGSPTAARFSKQLQSLVWAELPEAITI
jgi:hypothetical protein